MTEMDFIVSENLSISPLYGLLKLTPQSCTMPDTHPGQFVQVEVPHSKTTFLRRPISICYVDEERNQLWLLIRKAGEGTASLLATRVGETLNLVMPLGNGFSCSFAGEMMLIGGGVGVAPLLQLGKVLSKLGKKVRFLLGARSAADLLLLDEFKRWGEVYISTEDGSKRIRYPTFHPQFSHRPHRLLRSSTHDESSGCHCQEQGHRLRGVAREYDGLRFGRLFVLRGRHRRQRSCVCM